MNSGPLSLRICCGTPWVFNSSANVSITSSLVDAYPQQASQLLEQFQLLYDIENRVKVMSVDERLEVRQTESVSIWQSVGDWLASDEAADTLPKSKLGKAIGYLRNHWNALQLYLHDPLLPIDNNDVEQLMKQVAVGRKNWRAPDVLSRASGRLFGSGCLVGNVLRTLAV